ncbi:hypothetical protein HB943_11895 [Listeria weihenstephanensis]|uniref:Modifier protein of major autolysin LytC n=1 Tax=Listeria weihenstephanensis TaxID=1006155 RepID=A0A841ZA15_9LIST|nr:immunoglobulin-like domain-containing protein [Listeria weihenstephanensis]MBC1501306.1 hypothetical protein [Listeria weihenstephanensis]
MNNKKTLRTVATVVVASNVLASTFITAVPGVAFASENVGSSAEQKLLGSGLKANLGAVIQNTNLLKDPDFQTFTNDVNAGWYYSNEGLVKPLTYSNGAYNIADDDISGAKTVKPIVVDGVNGIQMSTTTNGSNQPQNRSLVSQVLTNLVVGQSYSFKIDYKVLTSNLSSPYSTIPNRFRLFFGNPRSDYRVSIIGQNYLEQEADNWFANNDTSWKTMEFSFVADSTTKQIALVDYPMSTTANQTMTSQFKNAKLINTDQAAPAAPTTTSDVYTNSTTVTGEAEANATVSVQANGTEIGTAKADANGNYTVTIPKQAYNTPLQITAQDIAGNISDAATTNVKQAPIVTPTIKPLTSKSTTASGTGEPGAALTFTANGINYTTPVAADGTWSVAIPKQAANTVVEATSVLNGVSSAKANATVAYEGPSTPVLDNVTNKATKVTGTGDPGNTITIKVKDGDMTLSYTGLVDDFGEFSIPIDTPNAGATVDAIAKDKDGTLSNKTTKTVLDAIAPDAPTVQGLTDASTKVIGKGEANCDVTVTLPSGGTIEGVTDADGNFSITIPKQAVGKDVSVTLTDAAGNKGAATVVTVQADILANPTINRVSNQDTKVTGTGVAGATVTVTANGKNYTGTVDANGNYEVAIPKLAAGLEVAVQQAKDSKTSGVVKTIVQDDRTPSAPSVNPVKDSDTKATGTGVAGDTITVKTPTGQTYTGVVPANGAWTVTIPAQAAGTKLDVTATTPENKVSPATTVTVAQTPQIGSLTAKDFTVGIDKNITGTFTGDVKNFRVTIGSTVYTGGSVNTDGTYSFYALDKITAATAATTYKIEALDKYGNVLNTKTANIIKNGGNVTPGTGTVAANGFVIHTDKNVTGTLTGDVKSIKLVYDGVTYSGGSISSNQFTFYALDKIVDKSKSARIDGYDANGNKIATSAIALTDSNDSGSIVGKGSVTANDFNVGTDKYITGAYTGDVVSIKVRVDGTTYTGGTLNAGQYNFYASDKITSSNQIVYVDGYDRNGNKIATSIVNVAKVLPITTGTIIPNTFKIPADKTLTASYTGDVKSVAVTINGAKYTGGTVSNGTVSFYIGDKITSTSDVVKIEAIDAYARVLDTENVMIQSSVAVPNTVTPAAFTIGSSYLTGTYSGSVKTVQVKINGTMYAGGTVADGNINFYIGNKVTSTTDSVIIYGYDANGTQVDTKAVTVVMPAPAMGTITPTTFSLKTSAVTGTYTGDAKGIRLTVNGIALTVGGTVSGDNFSYYVGMKSKITTKDDVVKVALIDKNGLVMDEQALIIVD